MASVISSSPRGEGSMALTAEKIDSSEQVDAHQGQVARRVLGLLDELHDVAVIAELGDAELVGVGHVGQQDLCVAAARAELVGEAADAVGEQVVAQVHHERLAGHELLGDLDRVRQAERRLLRDVGDRDAPRAAVAERGADLVGGVAHDHADVGDARIADRLDRVEEDRLVGHRHELLGAREGDGAQARAFAACENECFH